MKKILYISMVLLSLVSEVPSKKFVGDIYINRLEVFDTTQADWFFAAPVANSIHHLTREYVVEDELLFFEGDELNRDALYETVRNLRSTNLFSDVNIAIDSVSEYYYDVYLTTQDKWSTIPILIFGTGGNTTNIGGGFEELNFLGAGTHMRFEGYHRSENNIGWQGGLFLNQRRIFRSELYFDGGISANKFRTDQSISILKPFRTLDTKLSYGIGASNSYGRDFLYITDKNYRLMPFHERNLQLWIARSWLKNDRVFVSALLEGDDVDRGDSSYGQAFDNSGKFLVSFSSVAEDYFQTDKLNTYQKEDVPIGGWGEAVLGKIFPIGSQGQSFFYVGGQGEKSFIHNNLYLFGQVSGGSAFTMTNGYNSYEEFMGKIFYRFNQKLLVAGRLRQQTVWNWHPLRQLILDNDAGLRGYSANSLSADNRFVINTELRYFSDVEFWIFKLGGVAFWDFGTVWFQEDKLNKSKWHHSAGLGLRFFNMKGSGDNSIFRLDFAFNFDDGRFGEIIFTTNQLFSVFEKHRYKLPKLYGTEFDYE